MKASYRLRVYVAPCDTPGVAHALAETQIGFTLNFGTPHAEITIYYEGTKAFEHERNFWVDFFARFATGRENVFLTDITGIK